MYQINILSISTGDVDLLTNGMMRMLKDAKQLVLRTASHALNHWLIKQSIPFETLDSLYEDAEDFDAFNSRSAQYILKAAKTEEVVYAVPDVMTDSTVAELIEQAEDKEKISIVSGISHANRCLAMAKVDMQDIRLTTAQRFATGDTFNPRTSCFISELHSKACAGSCKLKMMELLDDDTEIQYFHCDDNGSLHYISIPLYELDRQPQFNHLSAVLYQVQPLENRRRFSTEDLMAVMIRLRSKGGCPWDAEQTHDSLLPNLLEESYEYIEAVQEHDEEHMCEELGDVLLQVVFHAVIAMQCGEFSLQDVTTAVTAKLIERHPHVFGSVIADTPDKVLDNWESIKRKQRGQSTVIDAMAHVSKGLSAALRASKVQHKAAKTGFDFTDAKQALEKVIEEHDEVLACLRGKDGIEEELGDLLFSVINVCRLTNVNADIVLNATTDKFIRRFQGMIDHMKSDGKSIEDLTLSEMDVYWMQEKQTP